MGSSHANLQRPQLWQVPLLVFSIFLFGYAAWLLIDPQPGPTFATKLELARTRLAQERPQPALDLLNEMLRDERLTQTQEGAIRLMLAQGLDLYQKEKKLDLPANHRQIIEQTRLAISMGIEPDAQALATLAHSYQALDKLPEALEQYRQLVTKDPKHTLKWQQKVIGIELATDAREAALKSLEAYLGSPDLSAGERAWALGEKAHVLIDRGDYAAARELLVNATRLTQGADADVARAAEQGQYRFWLGYAAWKLGDLAEAERHLRVARDLMGPTGEYDAEAALLLGQIHEARKDWDGAIAFYNSVLQDHLDQKEASEARLGRGRCRIARGDDDAGIMDITQTIKRIRDRSSTPARTREAALASLARGSELLTASGDYSGALELLVTEQQMLARPTGDFFARLARVYDQLSVQEAAALGQAKDRAEAERKLSQTRSHAGDAYVALSRELVLRDDKSYGQALWKGIEMYDRAGDVPRVISALETFTAERPNDPLTPDAYLRLGAAYHVAGLFDKAIDAYRRLQFRYPRSLAASQAGVPMARAMIAKGPAFYPRAERALKDVIENNPQVTPEASEFRDALEELAGLYHRTGRYELAIARLEEITRRYPNDGRMGQLLFLMGDSYRKSAGALETRVTDARRTAATSRPSFSIEEAAAARIDRLERARDLFRSAIDTYRKSAPATDLDRLYQKLSYFYLADCVYDLGQYAEAIKLYDDAAFRYQDDPSALAAYVQIVNANVAMGRLEEAKAANERAKWMLRRMPQQAFTDSSTAGALSKASWQKWLDWSAQSGLWK